MNLKKHATTLKLISLVSLSFLASSCGGIEIKNGGTCSVAGQLSAGGICSRLTSADTNDLSFNEFLDMLQAQPERTCVPVKDFNICADDQTHGTPVPLPKRAPAIVMSADTFADIKTELEQACRVLGNHCSKEMQTLLKALH